MTIAMGYRWHLERLAMERGFKSTTDLIAPLAERGIELSRAQVHRLVTQIPQRLNLDVLAALCDILGVNVGDLIEVVEDRRQVRKTGTDSDTRTIRRFTPAKAHIKRPDER
jgi:DNA-binding Xre family transcriptional regulator